MNKNWTGIALITVLGMAMTGCDKAGEKDANPTETAKAELSAAAREFKADCDRHLARLADSLNDLEKLPPPYTEATVLQPLNEFIIHLNDAYSVAGLMEAVHPDADLRQVGADCSVEYGKLDTRFKLSRRVYEAVSQVNLDKADPEALRNHQLLMRDFRLAGVDKDEQTRAQIKALNEEIERLGIEFDKNIREDVRSIQVTREELAGVPQDFIDARKPDENGLYTITTRYTDLFPVLTFAENDDVRRRLAIVRGARAYPQNRQVLTDLLAKRHQLAGLLGYDNYAEFITADKMVETPENVRAFIDEMYKLVEPAADRDIAQLYDRLLQLDPEAGQVNIWQTRYLSELIRREKYDLDAREVRQYFAYGKVKQGIFDLVGTLFGVQFRPWQTETWHPSVEAYEVVEGDRVLGRFFLDMHPREGKYQHAAAFSYQMGIEGRQLPMRTLVCNFPGENDPDELMEQTQVETFLHEFGHLMHGIFAGHHKWARLSGLQMEWDFVEAPSQMLEEWVWHLESLRTFATNAAGEPIPAALVEKMNKARMFGEGYFNTGQLYLTALSLAYHSQDPSNFDVMEKMLEIERRYSKFPHLDGTYFFANFGHLNNYSAMYYTYRWSQVIAADMFSEFKKHGLLDREVATRYRREVLSQGAAKPAAEAVEAFLGRAYTIESFAARFEEDP